uniref:protein NinF n=1 Tax=Bacteroides cellulosilyticus TaxID=246787 RepID=UPI0032EBE231
MRQSIRYQTEGVHFHLLCNSSGQVHLYNIHRCRCCYLLIRLASYSFWCIIRKWILFKE